MGRLLRCWIVVPLLGASAAAADAQDWNPIGPPGGAIVTVAVDPDAPDTVYAIGSSTLFRSANSGGSWQRQPVQLARSVAVASGGLVYVGGFGGYKSADGGRSWRPLGGLQNQDVYAIAVDPADAQVVYAATSVDVLKSGDGGASWAPSGGDLAAPQGLVAGSLAIDPGAPNTLYALIPADGVFKSTDGAASWQPTGAGLPTDCGVPYQVGTSDSPTFHDCLLSLSVDPTSPGTLYVGTDGKGVYGSTDGGATWAALGGDLGDRAVSAVAVDPSAPNRLYAGIAVAHDPSTGQAIDQPGGPVYRSADRGAFWSEASSGLLLAPVSAFAIDPRPSGILYVATDGAGVFASRDGGATWQPAERGLNATCLASIAATATTPTTVLTATISDLPQVAGGSSVFELPRLFASDDGGDTWVHNALAGGSDVTSIAVDPSDPSTVYASTAADTGVWKSVDGGRTWARRDTGLGKVFDLAIDPGSQTTLYASCGTCGVIKSTDGAATWSPANTGLPFISEVAVDDGTGTVYAAAEGVAFKSSDAGETWVEIAPVPQSLYSRLTVAPTTPATLFASTFEGIYVSRDGGDSWAAVSVPGADTSQHALYPLAVSPARPSTVYTMADRQLLRSDDAGRSWQPVGNALEVFPYDIAVDPNHPGVMYASTCGGGAYAFRQATQGSGSGGCAVGPPAAPGPAGVVDLLVLGLLAARSVGRHVLCGLRRLQGAGRRSRT